MPPLPTSTLGPLTTTSDLLRRLNPKHTAEHLNSLITLAPDLTEDLLSSVDQPLTVRRCRQTGRDYLLCDYNRDGDSYRSPWSNEFDPPLDESGPGGVSAGVGSEGAGEAAIPSERVRRMEIKANEAFDVYRELYYEGGVSSVYFWNLDDGFAGVVLLKKCECRPPLLLAWQCRDPGLHRAHAQASHGYWDGTDAQGRMFTAVFR